MVMRFCLVFAMFLCFAVSPASAGNQFVRCVQNQLVTLGHDPGPIDGSLGKRTRAALQKAVDEAPELKDLPRISNRFAVTWCRELADLGFRVRRHIPFYDGIVVKSDLPAGNKIEEHIVERLTALRIWYAQKYGFRTVSRPTIVIAQNGNSAVRLAKKAAKETGVKQLGEKFTRQKCKNPSNGQAAFAGQNILYFCLTNIGDEGSSLPRELLHFLVVAVPHEYFHFIQYELAADKVARFYRKGNRPPPLHLRPSWLVEGSADYFAYLYLSENHRFNYSVKWTFDKASPYKHSLRQISKSRTLSNTEHYAVSGLAARLLAGRNGPESLINYWEFIGLGLKHDVAFKKAFGMERKEFEKVFEKLRLDLKQSNQFVLGKQLKTEQPQSKTVAIEPFITIQENTGFVKGSQRRQSLLPNYEIAD
jgi:hypothetical protein